jgi:hypothetical protein
MYRQFTYYSYLQNKYGVDAPSTMLKIEADMMGIKYPLRPGWREHHKEWLSRHLEFAEVESFLAGLIRKKRATQDDLKRFSKKPQQVADLQHRLDSLQTGIDFILGREFSPVSREDRKLIQEELGG